MNEVPDARCLDCDVPVWEHGGHWMDDTANHHDRHRIGPPGCTDCDNPRPHSHIDPRVDGDTRPRVCGPPLVWSGKRHRWETPERREQHERARCYPRGL